MLFQVTFRLGSRVETQKYEFDSLSDLQLFFDFVSDMQILEVKKIIYSLGHDIDIYSLGITLNDKLFTSSDKYSYNKKLICDCKCSSSRPKILFNYAKSTLSRTGIENLLMTNIKHNNEFINYVSGVLLQND